MEIPKERLDAVRAEAERAYKAIGTLRCPYLDDDVHFGTEGFAHLLFKAHDTPRSQAEQYTRLRLLPLAEEVIRKSHTLQEYDRRLVTVRQKSSGRWNKVQKWVRYYVFVALIRPRIRIRVVVREIEGGQKHFFSLFPSWRIEKAAGGEPRKIFYSVDPADL